MSHTWEGGFHDSSTSYYAAVGYLCHQWNNVEHFVQSLASETLQIDFKMRAVLFRHMGVMSVLAFIQEYAEKNLSTTVHDCLTHTAKYVDRCRVNRNLIVHGFPEYDPETGEALIRSNPDKNRKAVKKVPISLEAVRRVCMECEQAGMLLIRGQLMVAPEDAQKAVKQSEFWPKMEQTLYAKPPLPKLLVEIPRKCPEPQRPDESSRA